jgi:hypothetical protein
MKEENQTEMSNIFFIKERGINSNIYPPLIASLKMCEQKIIVIIILQRGAQQFVFLT